jgi:DNA methylase
VNRATEVRDATRTAPLAHVRSIGRAARQAIHSAAHDDRYASLGSRRTGSVHEFYRYPARFTPELARAVINAFSRPGKVVLDPFVGGGTTLIEAQLLGRTGIGADINGLAVFVTRAKTMMYSPQSLRTVRHWAAEADTWLTLRQASAWDSTWEEDGYLRQLGRSDTWRLRNAIALALQELSDLRPVAAQTLARCALLRTSQWALDMRRDLPCVSLFREKLIRNAMGMADVAASHREGVRRTASTAGRKLPTTLVLQRGVPGLSDDARVARHSAPDLILTSPPYPGVYVNYHRWKLQGRKEIPAPFWIADCPDGRGITHYTMAARTDVDRYFELLEAAWIDLVQLIGPNTWIVQAVGFHDAKHQLPRYLDAMRAAGTEEVQFSGLGTAHDGRLWRSVPGRRWWVRAGDRDLAAPQTAREVVLFHRLAR